MKVLNARKVGTSVEGAVYVGRPSKFGNPFQTGRDGTREEVIAKFEEWFMQTPSLVEAAKKELKGKDLICWCAPLKCHADILIDVANEDGRLFK